MKKGWEFAGRVAVDTGCVVVVDPAYKDNTPEHWESGDYAPLQNEYGIDFGVIAATGWGDGHYPVYIERNKHGRVIALHIDFVPEGWNKDTE